MTKEFEAKLTETLTALREAAPDSAGAAVYSILFGLTAAHAAGPETLKRFAAYCRAFAQVEVGLTIQLRADVITEDAPREYIN